MLRSTVTRRTGSEGPHHDPYSFTEFTVTRQDGRTVTYHAGLGEYLKFTLPGHPEKTVEAHRFGLNTVLELFEYHAGISVGTAMRAAEHRPRHTCGYKYLHEVDGYPGETLTVCGKCGHIVNTHFNRSAIE